MNTFQYACGDVTPGKQSDTDKTLTDPDNPARDERLSNVAMFVAHFWRENRFGPTLREIQAELDISSLGTIRSDIDHLADAGWVHYIPHQSRTLVPTDKLLALT